MSAFPETTSFATATFATRSDVAARLAGRALSYVARARAPSLLDLGCGSGGVAVGAASSRSDLTAVALDISLENVQSAAAAAERAGVGARVTAVCADYLTWRGGEFDVIVSDSVLHIIPGTDTDLATRLAQSLKPGGVLVATIPVASAGNHLRILLRRAWRAMPAAADRVALAMARRLHPDFPAAMLQDRIPYLRFVPFRLHGPGFSATMARCRLDKIANEPWGSPSILKLEHRLVVWQRRD